MASASLNSGVAKTWGPNTLNNFTDEDVEMVKSWESLCSAMVAGLEVGKDGTPHIQFTMTFKKAMRLSGLKKLNSRVHWEMTVREANAFQYAGKDGSLIVDKPPPGRGARTDLIGIREDIEDGLRMADLVNKPYNYQCLKTAELILKYRKQKTVAIDKEVIWIWGPTGTGKTTWAFENYPDLYFKEGNKWWNNYAEEETVVIDEFRPDLIPLPLVLVWLNKLSFPAESKGGRAWVTAKRIIITSCKSPEDIYEGHASGEDIKQLTRRITRVMHFASLDPDL